MFQYFHGYTYDSSFNFFTQKLEQSSLTSTSFIGIFDKFTWAMFFASWLIVSALTLVVFLLTEDKLNKKEVSFYEVDCYDDSNAFLQIITYFRVFLIPYGVLFFEDESGLYNSLPKTLRGTSGTILRVLWNVTALFLTSAFACNLRSIMIKVPDPPILKTTEDFMQSGRPFLYLVQDQATLEANKESQFVVDRWMYENYVDIFMWNV